MRIADEAVDDVATLTKARGARNIGGWSVRRFRMGRPNSMQLTILLLLVGATILWELISRLGIVDALFISRPTAIAAALPGLAGDVAVREALAVTGSTMIRAFIYGAVAGISLGYAMGFVRPLRDAFYGPALFFLSIPKSIFIPVFMVLFGISARSAVYYGAFSAFIYIVINVTSGFDLIEDRQRTLAMAYGAKLRHRIMDVALPASTPGLFTGIWYGIKNAMQGVLIYELFVSVGGVGQLITRYTNRLETARVFALIIGISMAAILMGTLWTHIEGRLSRWRPQPERLVA